MRVRDMVIATEKRFRIHSAMYTDPAIFTGEMDRIFARTWIYVAHESQIPEPGDYCTTRVGTQPVIVTRDAEGQVHVLLNRCAHRGALVCRERQGHASTFRCPYHGWVYRNDGTLAGAAQRSGYPEDFTSWGLRLTRLPGVAVYRGLIFASLADDVEPLTKRLEHIREYVDLWCERSPVGQVELPVSVHRYTYPGNWKFQMENGVDGYHGNYVHESFSQILARSGERPVQNIAQMRNQVGSRNYAKGLSRGDGLLERESGMLGTFDFTHYPRYREQLEASYGAERAAEILIQRNIFIFPNLYLFESHIRVITPVTPRCTYVDVHPTVLDGVDEELNAARLREHERFFGPASFGATDDIEMFVSAQTGMSVDHMPWIEMSRGMHREHLNELGERVAHSTDETPQRAAYQEWLKLMDVTGTAPVEGDVGHV
ncbi:MAG: aromatic ring-hydroxylating oxygenase subunit alpha [Carbonactinosporaceae bacterium]